MGQKINVVRKVQVRSIVNDSLKETLTKELQTNLDRLNQDYEMFSKHRDAYIQKCRDEDKKPEFEMMKRMATDEERFKGSRMQVESRLNEVKGLEDGKEYVHGLVDSSVEITEGDNWHELMAGIEVVLENGIVKEIRKREVTFG